MDPARVLADHPVEPLLAATPASLAAAVAFLPERQCGKASKSISVRSTRVTVLGSMTNGAASTDSCSSASTAHHPRDVGAAGLHPDPLREPDYHRHQRLGVGGGRVRLDRLPLGGAVGPAPGIHGGRRLRRGSSRRLRPARRPSRTPPHPYPCAGQHRGPPRMLADLGQLLSQMLAWASLASTGMSPGSTPPPDPDPYMARASCRFRNTPT